MKLDEWQQEVLDHKGDFLLCTGRRVGKTYIMARKAIDRMAEKKTPIIVVSLTEDQAMIIITMALNYAREAYPKLIASGKNRPTLKTLTFKNGSRMISRPVGNTGDSARGFEGGVLMVDEASRMPKMFWIAAKPILLTTNGEMWLASTPAGKEGYFWTSFKSAYVDKDPDARFRVFYKTTVEVMKNRPLSDSWTIEQRQGALRILDEDKKEMSELEFGQEYLGLFLDEIKQFFKDDLIEKCCILSRNYDLNPQKGKTYLGCDMAGMGRDENTYEIIKKIDKNQLIQLDNIVKKKTLFAARDIIELNQIYKFKKIGIDDGGPGFGIWSELMRENSTKRKTIALNNSSRDLDRDGNKSKKLLKEDMYLNLLWLMETGRITLLNDDNLIASLRSIQYEYKIKSSNPSQMRIFGRYSHITEGLIRAAWLATKDKSLNLYCTYS